MIFTKLFFIKLICQERYSKIRITLLENVALEHKNYYYIIIIYLVLTTIIAISGIHHRQKQIAQHHLH